MQDGTEGTERDKGTWYGETGIIKEPKSTPKLVDRNNLELLREVDIYAEAYENKQELSGEDKWEWEHSKHEVQNQGPGTGSVCRE